MPLSFAASGAGLLLWSCSSSSLPVWVNARCILLWQPQVMHTPNLISLTAPDLPSIPDLIWPFSALKFCPVVSSMGVRGPQWSPLPRSAVIAQSLLYSHSIQTVDEPKCALSFYPGNSPHSSKPAVNCIRYCPLTSEEAEQGFKIWLRLLTSCRVLLCATVPGATWKVSEGPPRCPCIWASKQPSRERACRPGNYSPPETLRRNLLQSDKGQPSASLNWCN